MESFTLTFLVALAADGRQPGIHHDDIDSHEHGNEIGLVALTSHKVNGFGSTVSQTTLFFG